MRHAAKTDDNQESIVRTLRAVGATVRHLHRVGDGCPDLLVGYRGQTFLLEIKDGSKPPSQQKLTPAQEVWHRTWKGLPVEVVRDELEALEAIGVKARRA